MYPSVASLLLRFVGERSRRARGLGRRNRIALERRAHGLGDCRFVTKVARLGRIGGEIVDFHRAREDRLVLRVDAHHLRLPAVFEERLHRFRQHDVRRRLEQAVRRVDARPLEHGVVDAARAHRRRLDAGADSRPDHHERHVDRGLIQQRPVLCFAVIAEPFAVVGDDDDRRRSGHDAIERLDQPSKLLVHRRHFAEVRRRRVPRAVRLGRRVRRVRIVVVHPQKERLRGRRAKLAECRVGRVLRGALGLAGRTLVVEPIESTREAKSPGERERRHERGGAVARLVEPFSEHRPIGRHVPGVFMEPVTGRIETRHHRRVRRQSLGNRRIRLQVPASSRDEAVVRGRLDAGGVRAD